MKRQSNVMIAAIVVGFSIGGCASIRQDLVKDETVQLDLVPVDEVTYVFTNVEQKGVWLYVFGRVGLKDPKTARTAPGHIDISIADADGKTLWIDHAPYKQYHHTGYRNQVQYNSSARILVDVGAVVRLKHHFADVSIHDDL